MTRCAFLTNVTTNDFENLMQAKLDEEDSHGSVAYTRDAPSDAGEKKMARAHTQTHTHTH